MQKKKKIRKHTFNASEQQKQMGSLLGRASDFFRELNTASLTHTGVCISRDQHL